MKPQTLVIIKPDAYEKKLTKKIIDRLKMKNTEIVNRFPMRRPSISKLKKHFIPVSEKHGELIANKNIEFYKKGPIEVLILESKIGIPQEEFISKIRELIGNINPKNAKKETIRSWSNDSLEQSTKENRALKNLIHSSDSIESFNREKSIWFN